MIPYGDYQAAPATDVLVITPSDTVDLEVEVRAIRCATGGNLKIDTPRSRELNELARTIVFSDGETRPVRALRVYATGTTAGGIEGLV